MGRTNMKSSGCLCQNRIITCVDVSLWQQGHLVWEHNVLPLSICCELFILYSFIHLFTYLLFKLQPILVLKEEITIFGCTKQGLYDRG